MYYDIDQPEPAWKPPETPPDQPPEYPKTQAEWRAYVMSVGLREFGDRNAAQIFERQLSWESGGYNPDVIFKPSTERLERGMAQYMPAMVQSRGIDPLNPFQQVPDAAKLMHEYLNKTGGNWRKALSYYNAGEGGTQSAISKGGENWEEFLPAVTRVYLREILPVTPEYPVVKEGEEPVEDIYPGAPQYYPEYEDRWLVEESRYTAAQSTFSEASEATKPPVDLAPGNMIQNILDWGGLVPMAEPGLTAPLTLGPLTEDMQKRTQELRQQVAEGKMIENAAGVELMTSERRTTLMRDMPFYMMSNPSYDSHIGSIEDMYRVFGLESMRGIWTDADYQWAEEEFNRQKHLINDGMPITLEEAHEALQQPARPKAVGIHLLTNEEILKALTLQYVPTAPGGATQAELAEEYRLIGRDEEEIQEWLNSLETDLDERVRMTQDLNAQYALFKAGLADPQPKNLSAWESIKMAVLQPMLFVVEMLSPYEKYIGQPFAHLGTRYITPILGAGLAGISPERGAELLGAGKARREELDYLWQHARKEGYSWWEAYSKAWEEADINWGYKLLAGVAYDPLNLADIGLTIASKSRFITKMPFFGKFVGETVAIRDTIGELPFEAFRAIKSWIPQTTAQRAMTEALNFTDNIRAAVKQRYPRSGLILNADEVAETLSSAARAYMLNPVGTPPSNAYLKAGKAATAISFIEPDEVAEMATRFGVTDYIPAQTDVLNVNKVFEDVSPLALEGIDNGIVKVTQAPELLLRAVGADITNDNLRIASRIIETKLANVLRNVDNIVAGDSARMMIRKAFQYSYNLSVSNANSKVAVLRQNQKIIGSIMNKVDWLTKAIQRVDIERKLVSPFATAYLVFANYGPPNWIETIYRAMMSDGALTAGRTPVQRAQRIFGELGNAPHDIMASIPRSEYAALPEAGDVLTLGRRAMQEGRIPGWNRPIEPLERITQRLTNGRFSVGSALDVNQWWGKQQLSIRSATTTKWYLNGLYEKFPTEMREIQEAVTDLASKGLTTVEKKDIADIIQYIREEAIRGPEAVRATESELIRLNHKKMMQEATQSMNKLTTIDMPVKDAILRELDRGVGWDDIDDLVERGFRQSKEYVITKLEPIRIKYKNLAMEIKGLDITREEDLAKFYNALFDITQTQEKAVENYMAAVEDLIMDTHYAKRDSVWDTAREYVNTFLESTDRDIQDIVEALRAASGKISPSHLDDYLTLGEQYRLRSTILNETRKKEADVFNRMKVSKPRGGPANETWWANVNTERRTIWNQANEVMAGLDDNIDGLVNAISRVQLPQPRYPSGPITLADVQYLFGATGDDITRNLYDPSMQAFISKRRFTSWVRRRANSVGRDAGISADDMGFTAEALGEVYDSMMRTGGFDPRTVDVLTPQREALEGLRQELHTIRQGGAAISGEDIQIMRDWIEEVATNLEGTSQFTSGAARSGWMAKKEEVMAAARTKYGNTFTDYSPGNMADAFMHSIFPYWTYESQRFPYLASTFLKHPGMFTAFGRYMDYSDGGYITIPGTSLEINPFRGTVFMGAMRSLFIRDYPEFLDAYPGVGEVVDYLSRWGFWPGIHVMLPMVVGTGIKYGTTPEWGQLLPAAIKTPINALVWLMPDSNAATALNNFICPDRMKDVIAIRYLGTLGIEGSDIYSKITLGMELDEEEQNLWNKAMSVAAGYSALFEQGLPFRYNPPERKQAYDLIAQAYEDFTGVPVEVQNTIRRRVGITGQRLEDVIKLTPLQEYIVREMDIMKGWMGSTMPFQPLGVQRKRALTNIYWKEREKISDQALDGFYNARTGELIMPGSKQLEEHLRAGEISTDQWRTEMGNLQNYKAGRIDTLNSEEMWKEVPITLEERMEAFKEQSGHQLTFHPEQELLYIYYDIQPERHYDDESMRFEWDFDSYYAKIDFLLDALPEPFRSRLLKTIQFNWTDTQKLYWEHSRNFIRPYRNTRIMELSTYPPEERAIIRRSFGADQSTYQALQDVTDAEGQKIIAKYRTNLTTVKKNLRLIYPQWNAVISYWYPNTALLTPQAFEIHEELISDYGGRPKTGPTLEFVQ